VTTFVSEITLLADHPELAAKWAELQWQEWGDEPGREELSWWINHATQATERERVPVAFAALGERDEVLGGVGLNQYDLEERRDRSPWIVGTIVRPDRRSAGIGRAMMARLASWAAKAGIEQVWVATGGRAVVFYQQCGYEIVETVPTRDGGAATVLTTRLSSSRQHLI
jgi:GNAT superfamily N-acetyltransferase